MIAIFSRSISLLLLLVVICCGIYPFILWAIGQTVFPFQANGSLLIDKHSNPVGSKLIAQPFSKDEYFHPRLSAASYDASASASSSLAASNYALRDRVARTIGSIVKYQNGPKAGQLAASDIEKWFQVDKFQGNAHIVSQWATLHNALATAWVNADPKNGAYVDEWAKSHPELVAKFVKDNPNTPQPKAADLAVVFFQQFSQANPGKFLSIVTKADVSGKEVSQIEMVNSGADIQTVFFAMWRQEHPDIALEEVPGDYVTTSASGLDPHITLANAEFQLERVASKWAEILKRSPQETRLEIKKILDKKVEAPIGGLIGEKFVNVLEVNLELHQQFGG